MSDLHNTLACGHPWSDHNAHGCTDMYCHCKVPGRELKNQELPPLEEGKDSGPTSPQAHR